MRYMGGKAKVGKQIAAVLLTEPAPSLYLEPFVGACGVMEHVAPIMRERGVSCVGADKNGEMIAFWRAIQSGWTPPENVDEAEYRRVRADANEDPALRGFVSVGCSFGGKVWGGYARSGARNYAKNAQRSIKAAAPAVKCVSFVESDYLDWSDVEKALVYLDPPYAATVGWGGFDSLEFWRWAESMSRRNVVFVSEYVAPVGWTEVWSKTLPSGLRCGNNGSDGRHTERLFRFRG